MQDLDRALTDIKAMRSQLARGTEFRGFGPVTVALTGALALAAAFLQQRWVGNAGENLTGWALLWVGTAAISVTIIGVEMVFRARRVHSGLADDMIQAAAIQLLPAAGAGAMLTLVLWRYVPGEMWMLPGLWQLALSLGIFAACRTLPPAMNVVAFWYFGTGLVCIAFANGPHAFCPWAMGAPFATGEALAALLLAIATKPETEDEDFGN